jgi:Ca2+-binding RTX toxin-like protein
MTRQLMLAVVLALWLPSVALAGEAHIQTIGSGYKDSIDSMAYTAAPGERNRIVVAADNRTRPPTIVLRDTGARVLPGNGCSAIDAQTVACEAYVASVDAGDGDDTVTTPTTDFDVVVRGGDGADTLTGGGYLSGGPGDDVLAFGQLACMGPCLSVEFSGGGGDDVLRGGPGNDTLSGDGEGRPNPYVGDDSETGPLDLTRGNDTIAGGSGSDTVRYARSRGVRVDLADRTHNGAPGERDRLTGVENVITGDGDDVVVGDQHDNRLVGGSGADTLIGRGGNDVLLDERPGATQDFLPPTAPDGDDTLRGGAGNDELVAAGEPGDRLFGGPGDDLLINEYQDIVARTLNCGSGSDRIGSPPQGQLLAGCERVVLGEVRVTARPRRRPGRALRFTATCVGPRAGTGCAMKVTLRLGSRRIAQRSLKLGVRTRRAFLVIPTRTVRRGDVLAIAVSGRASSYFSGRWRVRV